MNATRTTHRIRHGFTIVEAVAVISILGAIGSVVSGLIFSAARSYADASASAQLQAELSAAMARMMRELRYIPVDPNSAPLVPKIDSVSPGSISWNNNNSLSLSGSQVQLVLSGRSPEVLLQNVTAFTISTFDQDNTALGASISGPGCFPVRRVEVVASISRGGRTETLRSRVFLRGLMAGS
jgi:type II secretory pathway pseudopilin PulG